MRLGHLLAAPIRDALLATHPPEARITRALIEDDVLAPVDKLVWMVLATRATAAGPPVSVFPSHAAIARGANVQSPATVSRALTILRVTRWLLAVARPGKRPLYVLCEGPLEIAAALTLDPRYRSFLEQAENHHHARVRSLAKVERTRAEGAVSEPLPTRTAHRANRMPTSTHASADRSQPAEGVHPKSTTAGNHPLIYPRGLLADERPLADGYLAMIAPEARQAVLDELAGRLQATERGAKPVYDRVQFLRRLCEAVQAGTFQPNLGISVRVARSKQPKQSSARPPLRAEPSDPAESRRAAKYAFATLRTTLGHPSEPPSK